MIKKEAENILKYKDLRTEIERMWENKSETKDSRGNFNSIKFIQKISEKHDVKELEKTVLLGAVHIIHNVLI